MTRHMVRKAATASYADLGDGLSCWSIVDETFVGAVHTEFSQCALAPFKSVPARVQSFEECFFVLSGTPVLTTPEGSTLLGPGDYGLLPPGVAHSWRNARSQPARWARMRSPQPRSRYGFDTVAVPALLWATPVPVDVRDPRTRLFGHIDAVNSSLMSPSMRTALLVYSGITVKMMVNSDLGALLTTMFMVQYDEGGVADPHDHPFEETYLFLEGSVEASFDGTTYQLEAGDVAFAGVGCVHGFRNVGSESVRWLETQAPQPPGRHSYRFVRDWDYLRDATGGQ